MGSDNNDADDIMKENEELYNSKYKHKVDDIHSIETYNKYFVYIYIGLNLILVYFLYKSVNLNKYIKVVIMLLFIIYPFVISNFESYIYNAFFYMVDTIYGTPYNKKHSPYINPNVGKSAIVTQPTTITNLHLMKPP